MEQNFNTLFLTINISFLISRLLLGSIFLYYGLPKLKNLKKNAVDFNSMGFKPGIFWGTIVAVMEVFNGLALILGLFFIIVAPLVIIQMLIVTIWKITKAKKTFSDYSYDLLILALALILFIFGPGTYSILLFF